MSSPKALHRLPPPPPPLELSPSACLLYGSIEYRTFYRVYTVEGICMLALRFFHYRWSRQHY